MSTSQLSATQLATLRQALHEGAGSASAALSKWTGRPAAISFDAVEQLSLADATGVLGRRDEPICFCAAELRGRLSGVLVLAFDDASGLALADMLLDQPRGTAAEWGEMETSAALETGNIVCCAYLNAVLRVLPPDDGATELLPGPPRLMRDFAESLIECALMEQGVDGDRVLLARTQFSIDGEPVDWTLLIVPDSRSMAILGGML